MRRFMLPLLCLAALCGCRSTLAPVVTAPDVASMKAHHAPGDVSVPTLAPKLHDLKVSVKHGNLVFDWKLDLNGWTLDQWSHVIPVWSPGDRIPAAQWFWFMALDTDFANGTDYTVGMNAASLAAGNVIVGSTHAPARQCGSFELSKQHFIVTVPLDAIGGATSLYYAAGIGTSYYIFDTNPDNPGGIVYQNGPGSGDEGAIYARDHGHAPDAPQVAAE